MAECVWLEPKLVGQFEFVEWTADAHLRHSKFVALREDSMQEVCDGINLTEQRVPDQVGISAGCTARK